MQLPKSSAEIRLRIKTLKLLIEDARKRIESNITDNQYVDGQLAKIKEWDAEKQTLRWVLNSDEEEWVLESDEED